mgnify:CR=1 FL=1
MKKLILLLFIPLVFACSSSVRDSIRDLIPSISSTTNSEEDVRSALLVIADEINKQCPMTVDAFTRLDNVAILSERTVQYNYTLISQKKEDFDLSYAKKNFYPKLVNEAKTNPGLKIFRELKVTLSYYYKDKNGLYITTYKIKPHQYLN